MTYQWRKNSLPQTDATNSIYAIASAQHPDAGSYDVIVANGVNSRTSAVATLTVRDPLNLAWTGLNGATWDTTNPNWGNTNNLANVAYTGGDNVLFDSRGASVPSVSLAETLNPSSVTVEANFDYTLRSDAGGKIVGTTGLTKRGTGTLILDTDNTYSGSTLIQAGVVQVDPHGSTGTGPITNNSGLVYNRTNSVILTNATTSSGGLTNMGFTTVTLAGVSTYSGPIAVQAGTLILLGNQPVSSTDIIVTPSTATGPGGSSGFGISGGMVIGAGTTLHLSGSTAAPDCRSSLVSTSGSNVFNGPIVLDGSGNNALRSENAGTTLVVNGNVTGTNGFTGSFFIRGSSGSGIMNGTINLPGAFVAKPDSGT